MAAAGQDDGGRQGVREIPGGGPGESHSGRKGEIMKPMAMRAGVIAVVTTWAATAAGGCIVTLKSRCNLFALDSHSGAVLAVDSKTWEATLYPRAYLDGFAKRVAGPVTIPPRARGVLFKRYAGRGYFVICFRRSLELLVLRAENLKPAGTIAVGRAVGRRMAATTDSNDPNVYYAAEDRRGGGWVSLKTMAEGGRMQVRANQIAVSADGRYAYCRSTDPSIDNLRGYRRTVGPAGKPVWIQMSDQRTSTPGYLPDPLGRFCAVGRDIYLADLTRKVGRMRFHPECFFATVPVIAGLHGDKIRLASYNTFQTIATRALPADWVRPLAKLPSLPIAQRRARRRPARRGRGRPGVPGRLENLGAARRARRRPRKGPPEVIAKMRERRQRVLSQRRLGTGIRGPRECPVTLLADDRNRRLLAASRNQILIMPLAELKVPDEPMDQRTRHRQAMTARDALRRKEQQDERKLRMIRRRRADAAGTAAGDRKIRDLERRIEKLEARIEQLISLVERRSAGPAPPPKSRAK